MIMLHLHISDPESRIDEPILVCDADHNDIAEFFHNGQATVPQSYETALSLALRLVEVSSIQQPKTTGIDDVEWLDAKVVELSAENTALRSSLRVMLALMESDVEFKYVSCGETRQKVMTEARALVPNIKV